MTNKKRISTMTDEEFIQFFGKYICEHCRSPLECRKFNSCDECKASWLTEPANEEVFRVVRDD